MRTLKFRYWSTITKEMVNNPKMPYKENWTIEQLFEDRGWVWMQFTGLTDRHGVDIYEGDIIAWETGKCPGFQDCKMAVEFYFGQLGTMQTIPAINNTSEIIGNIYENGDLLK